MQELLDVTRLNAGRLELRPEDVELTEIARDVCERLHDQAERAGSADRAARRRGGPRRTGIRVRLDQVLTNLLTNAIKYGAGEPIEVSIEPSRRERRRRSLRVRDHGMGIAPRTTPASSSGSSAPWSDRNEGGLGLGLWIARQFVEIMGGTIAVDSAPGEGATFVVELPASIRSAPSG